MSHANQTYHRTDVRPSPEISTMLRLDTMVGCKAPCRLVGDYEELRLALFDQWQVVRILQAGRSIGVAP
jgi:hypothetical protein